MRNILSMAALVWAGAAVADPTGAELQALVTPNGILGDDGRIAVLVMDPVDGFEAEMEAIDREGVIDLIDDTGTPEGVILFSPSWTAAAYLAETFGAADLSARLLANEGQGRAIDIGTVPSAGGEPLHFYTVVPGEGGVDIPAVCYARLFGSVIYAAGQPTVFGLAACMESVE